MTSPSKVDAAKALFPLLSAFHQVSGLPLRSVYNVVEDSSLTEVILDFESKLFFFRANADDDSIEFWFDRSGRERARGEDVSNSRVWAGVIGKKFGWGWVAINQQGFLDSVLISFEGIDPQLMLTVIASSLEISHVCKEKDAAP